MGLASHDAGAWGTDNGRRSGSSAGSFDDIAENLSVLLDDEIRPDLPVLGTQAVRGVDALLEFLVFALRSIFPRGPIVDGFSVVFWRWGQYLVALDFTRFLVGGQLGRGRDFLVVVIVVSVLGCTS